MLEQKLCLQVFHMHAEGSLDIYFPLGAGYSYKYSKYCGKDYRLMWPFNVLTCGLFSQQVMGMVTEMATGLVSAIQRKEKRWRVGGQRIIILKI